MELRHLRYFAAVAEHENVSRAALRLHVSQPAVSRQVRDLEEEIGLQLLERDAKSVRLTAAGRVFLEEARAVLARADEAVAKARAAASPGRQVLQVGCAPSLTSRILPRALRRFQAERPQVRVALHDLSTEEMISGLIEGKLQLALLAWPGKKALRGLEFRELARCPLRAAFERSHPLARSRQVRPAQLAGEPLIALSRRDYPEFHEALDRWLGPERRRLRIAEEHDGTPSIVTAVESGAGFALLPSAAEAMAGPGVKLVPLAAPAPEVPVGAAWRRKSETEALRRLLTALTTTAAASP